MTAAAALSVAVIAASCGGSGTATGGTPIEPADSQTQLATGNDDSNTAQTAQIETRPEILQLALPQLDGAVFDPNSVAGRDVLLWFWAPW